MLKLSQTLVIAGIVASFAGTAFAAGVEVEKDSTTESAVGRRNTEKIKEIQKGKKGVTDSEQALRDAHEAGTDSAKAESDAALKRVSDALVGTGRAKMSDNFKVIVQRAVTKFPTILDFPVNDTLKNSTTLDLKGFNSSLEPAARIVSKDSAKSQFMNKLVSAVNDLGDVSDNDKRFLGDVLIFVAGADAADVASFNTPSGIQQLVDIAHEYRANGGGALETEEGVLIYATSHMLTKGTSMSQSMVDGFITYLEFGGKTKRSAQEAKALAERLRKCTGFNKAA